MSFRSPVLLCLLCATVRLSTGAAASTLVIHSPRADSRPHSGWLGVDGNGPSGNFDVLENGAVIYSGTIGEDGHFDFVLHPAAGEHAFTVQSGSGATVPLHVTIAAGFAQPHAPAAYDHLQIGDIIFSRAMESEQIALYGPKFTHSALYLGPDADGTPQILEAVAQRGDIPYGRIAAVAPEESDPWIAASAAVCRLRGGFLRGERQAFVDWTRATAAREPPFWTVTEDFGSLLRAWLMWDRDRDEARDPAEFQRLLASLRARMLATDKFNCATLVWRAYLEATHGRVDLSQPNRVVVRSVTPHFMESIRPVLLVPDTMYLSGKLEEIAQ